MRKPKHSEKDLNLSQVHFFHHKSQMNFPGIKVKVKVKLRCGALFSTEALWLIVLLTPKEFLHSSLEALHAKRRERPLLAKEGTIVGI
jgi:hypothetical protein